MNFYLILDTTLNSILYKPTNIVYTYRIIHSLFMGGVVKNKLSLNYEQIVKAC